MSYIIEKTWEAHGFPCVVIAIDMGHRCGYVGVTDDHPLYGRSYCESVPGLKMSEWGQDKAIGKRGIIPIFLAANDPDGSVRLEVYFDVHGGLTYSRGENNYPVEAEGVWWFGFDAGHAGDCPDADVLRQLCPGDSERIALLCREGYGEVRTLEYMTAECESLANQLKAFTTVTAIKRRSVRKNFVKYLEVNGGTGG